MQALFDMIYTEGDVIATAVHMFIFGFSLTFVLGFANIIRDAGRTARS